MDSYNSFAEYYDALTEDARYAARCEYILETARRFNHDPGKTLDLACGTGSLTLELWKRGVDVFGADGSVEMLSEAVAKCSEAGADILFVRQEMQALEPSMPIDTCVCTLDSLNHLTDEADVQSTFDGVARKLRDGGLFIFDVNTVYKHRVVLADNVFVTESDRVFCVWQNFPRENDIVDISLDFFEERNGVYHRSCEDFSERAYSEQALRGMLEKAGFEVLSVCGDLSFDPPAEDEQRVIFTARKRERYNKEG